MESSTSNKHFTYNKQVWTTDLKKLKLCETQQNMSSWKGKFKKQFYPACWNPL